MGVSSSRRHQRARPLSRQEASRRQREYCGLSSLDLTRPRRRAGGAARSKTRAGGLPRGRARARPNPIYRRELSFRTEKIICGETPGHLNRGALRQSRHFAAEFAEFGEKSVWAAPFRNLPVVLPFREPPSLLAFLLRVPRYENPAFEWLRLRKGRVKTM